jgi:VWFA-related protein
VFVGGRNLWRIDISEPASDPNTWIGGYTADNNSFGFYNPQNSESHHPDQHAVAFRPSDGDVMYVGSDGGLHRTNDSRAGAAGTAGDKAVKWESLNDGYHTNQPYAVCMHSTSSRIGWGMQDNGSMSTSHLTPADQWTDELGADGGFCEINDKASGSGTARYFTIQNGPVIRFDYDTNGNRTGGSQVDPPNASGQLFINPFEIDPSDRSVMYYPAGQNLYRTTSAEADPRNNANWTELTGSSSAVSNIITALTASENNASNVLYFGTSSGNLFRLDNANGASAGTSPTDVTGGSFPNGFVSSIAVHPENSDEVIVTFSNYGVTSVFRTTDGGSNWTSIEGNLSGPNGEAPSVRAAAILPASSSPSHQSSTDARYYLGTSVGAFSTTSLSGGSTTWAQEAQDGFENVVVDDIRARSSDGLVVAGTHGKGVFTRGGGTVSDLNLTINSFTLGQFPWIRVLVSVTNQSGNAVSGLGRENFDLTDESRLEGVVKAEEQNQGGSRAISTSMVLDRSGSMDGLLGDLKTAAKQYVDELQQGDRAAVIYFDNAVDLDQQFTDDKSALKSAIDARSTGGSTAIYDATIRGIREVEQEANTRAVISMTDGKENASTNTKQDVIDLANQGEQIPIYTVTLGSGADQSPMQDISSKTGGRHFHAPSASDLTAIYNDISQQLARRYRLTYRTTNESRDGTTRPVKVRAARQEQSGSATGSYDAPSQSVPTVAQYASPPQPGQQTTANVQVGNQSQQVSDLFRMTFTLNYDQNNLTVDNNNISAGDLFSGANIDEFRSSVDAQAGEIDIGVRLQSSNSPSAAGVVARRAATDGVDGSGSAADVDFTVDSNAPSDTEPSLSVSNVEASESDGSSIGTVSTSISGSVRYADVDPQGDLTGGDPIEGATVEAIDGGGTAQDSDQSSASTGGYRMPVPPGESYDVVVTDVSGSPQGIDTRDAFDIQANRLGLDNIANFGSFQETLGDVNGDGVADTRDAFAVQAFVVSGNTSPSFQAGKFHNKQAAVNVSTTDETAELRAAAIGDANLDGGFGSSSSPALAVSRTEDVASGGIGTTNGESLKSASSGSTLEVPIRAGISAELGLFEFTVTYPNEKASFQGVESSKDGVEANSQDGTVRVSWFDRRGGESPMSVEKGEPIVVLQFEKTGSLEKNESFRLGDIGGLLGGPSGELLSEASVEVPTVNAGAAGPEHFALKGNAPNPFGRETMLRMDVPEEGRVTVAVYDMLGRRVATIEEKLSPGRDRTVEIEGKQLGSGKYLYRVRAEIGGETVQKSGEMTVVR